MCVYICTQQNIFQNRCIEKDEMKRKTYKRKRNKKKRKKWEEHEKMDIKKERLCILFSDLHCMRILAQPISYPFLTVYSLHPSYWMTFLLLASPEEWTDNTLRTYYQEKMNKEYHFNWDWVTGDWESQACWSSPHWKWPCPWEGSVSPTLTLSWEQGKSPQNPIQSTNWTLPNSETSLANGNKMQKRKQGLRRNLTLLLSKPGKALLREKNKEKETKGA